MQPNFETRTVFLGDNIDFLQGMNSECVDLIYTDPPFNKKKEFTAPIGSQAEGASFLDYFTKENIKDEWVEEFRQENYELHSFLTGVRAMSNMYNYCYLVYMAIRIIECHRILKSTGSFYLHCDPTMNWGLRAVLDCIFGEENFRNEIVWCYTGPSAARKNFPAKSDTIYRYSKTGQWTFNNDAIRIPYVKLNTGKTSGIFKQAARLSEHGKVPENWWPDISPVGRIKQERTGYPTQKPLALLERIIAVSSNEGDLVLDPFCGCVTTCIAAERLERKWVGIDVAKEAWNQIETRLQRDVPPDMFRGKANFSTVPPKRGKEDIRPKKYVYVISNPAFPGIFKVGIATDAEKRLNAYQTADPKRAYQLEFKILTAEYKALEPYIHHKFNGDYEWVPGDLNTIIKAMKDYTPT